MNPLQDRWLSIKKIYAYTGGKQGVQLYVQENSLFWTYGLLCV